MPKEYRWWVVGMLLAGCSRGDSGRCAALLPQTVLYEQYCDASPSGTCFVEAETGF